MSFNKKQLKKDSPKKNAIDLKLKPITKNPNYKYGFSELQPREGNLMLGAGFGNSKIGMGAMGMTPIDAENRKYFKGLVDANINYNVNPNLNFKLGINDVIGGGFNPGINAGIKLKFEEGGEYVDAELDENDIEYYRGQGYLVEYVDGGDVSTTEPEYTYLELDDDAIQQYKNGGWVVEDMDVVPEFEVGGTIEANGWEYRQDGDNILTKKANEPDWITATGDAKKAIQNKHFPGIDQESLDISAHAAGVVQPTTNTESQLTRDADTRAIQNSLAEGIDGKEGYYLGPKGVDGRMGKFTERAMAAKEAGISPAEFNKQYASTPLQTVPGVSVPSSVVQRANGITPPVSSRLSAIAEASINESGILAAANEERESDKEVGHRVPFEEYDPAKLWEDEPEHIIGVDLGDEVYQHADDFIYNMSISNQTSESLTKNFGDKYSMQIMQSQATSCLKGAKECNRKYVAGKVGANSIAGLINQIERADLTKYSIPSRGGNQGTGASGAFEHTMGFDAWEAADAMVGEGLAQYLFKVSPDSHKDLDSKGHPKESMQPQLKKLVADGKIPLGSLVMMGDSSDEYGNKYTSSNTGPRDSHAATVVGFNEKGVPMIYDYGNLVPITENVYKYGINSVVVPKGYENYTHGNLMKGKQKRNDNLGYTNEYVNEKFKANEELKPYVNQIREGAHEVKYKIGSDYNVKADVMDKLSDRIIGIAGKETNFGNHGGEDVSYLRQAAIELESDWTNKKLPGMDIGLKTYAKQIQDLGVEEKKGKADWEIEIMANKSLGLGNTYNHDKIEHRTAYKEAYRKLRNEYPKSTGKDKDPFNSSVGPFAVKNLPLYAKEKLGLSKDLMYGMNIDDKDEFKRGAKASLIHLVEDFVNLRADYPRDEYTDDQIIDLATIAYNNKGKAYSPDFAEYYIKNAQSGRSDDYLKKVKALEYKYAYDKQRKNEAYHAMELASSKAWYSDGHKWEATESTGEDLMPFERAQATVAESTGVNMPTFEQYPQIDITRPRIRGQRDTRSGKEQSTVRGLGSNAQSVYKPTSDITSGRPAPNLHLRNYRKDGGESSSVQNAYYKNGGEIKGEDLFIDYLKRKSNR